MKWLRDHWLFVSIQLLVLGLIIATEVDRRKPTSVGQEYDLFFQACECQP
jgi:hypothetical protein